jgi:hypothetical protein
MTQAHKLNATHHQYYFFWNILVRVHTGVKLELNCRDESDSKKRQRKQQENNK